MNIGTWTRDYDQNAIVTMISHDKPHNGRAIEHFRSQGPFAVLPYIDDKDGNHRSAIVWTVDRKDIDAWLKSTDDVFTTAIQERTGDIFGTVQLCGARAVWPLSMNKAYSYIAPRMCLIAEAAHGIHPIAGQGLNMSLRDIAALTDILDGADDVGDMTLLKQYQKARRGDNLQMVLATDTLNDLFGYNNPIIRAARRFGLSAVSNINPAKQFFMKQAMGALGHLPTLVREHRQSD
jgi:2-octaprenyl-6-methoxyphenol hydroxylase